MPMTQSLLVASCSCTLVVLSVSTRVVLYSTLQERLLCKVTSRPRSGEKFSLMLTVEILNMLLGTGLPVVASVTNPRPFMNSCHVLKLA